MRHRTTYWILAAGFAAGSLFAGCQQGSEDIETRQGVGAPLLFFDSPTAIEDQYIVVFKGVDKSSVDAAIKRVVQFKDSSKVEHRYSVINGFSARLTPKALEEMRMDKNVLYIEQDQAATLGTTYPNPPNGLDRVDARLGRDNSYNDFGRLGRGVHVYIIDTGIRATHNEFTNRVSNGTDTVDNDSNPDDCHGHGTHVASTAVGTDYGLAKEATLHGVRVLNCQGSGTNSGVIAGVDWVTANHVAPAVANMSLGGGASQATDDAVNNSVAAGIVYAVAAGNDGSNACNYSPARAADALTVGATENTSDNRASFSNYGTCVDIFAPGRSILGAWIGSDSDTNTISGTSMASPHVAGAAALYRGSNPNATPAQVEDALEGVATVDCVNNPGNGSPNLLLYTDFDATDAGPHCDGGGDPGDPDPNSCFDNNACGDSAPGGCGCDFWCAWFGDCCADGPC